RNVSRAHMSGTQAESDRDIHVVENSRDHLLKGVVGCSGWSTILHFAKDNSPYAVQFARVFKMHQHAVDAIGPLAEVLDKQNGVVGFDFIRCAQGSDEKRETAAIKASFGSSGTDWLQCRRIGIAEAPRLRSRNGTQKRFNMYSIGLGEIFCQHGTVKAD